MRRSRPRFPERLAAVPAPRLGQEQLVLRAPWRIGGEPGADASDRPPVHQAAVPRHPKDPQVLPHQSQASAAAHGPSGFRGSMPQAINEPSGSRAQDLPVFAAESADRQARCERRLKSAARGGRKVQRLGWGWNLLRQVSCSKDWSVRPSVPPCVAVFVRL